MTLKARRKAGMPLDKSGKPLRPYTNPSESMNNVFLQAMETYVRSNRKSESSNLSKLEFTRNVVEAVHEKQQLELQKAIYGDSEEYQLSILQHTFQYLQKPGLNGRRRKESITSQSLIK